MKRLVLLLIFLGLAFSASEIDENALFESETMMVSSVDIANPMIDHEFEKESTALTGMLQNRGTYSMPSGALLAYGSLEFQLDVRLKKNYKGFVNLQVANNGLASPNSLALNLKEFFLDLNINRQAYVRVGKQVLQWGRNYFWNPTDLINVDHRDFMNLSQTRSGTYGIKTHVPFGTALNLYSFIDFSAANTLGGLAGAGKVEWVTNGSEMALSLWGKQNLPLVVGWEISTRVTDWDVAGELSYSKGELSDRVIDASTINRRTDADTFRTSLGITRYFDWDYKDRISLTFEGFFQTNGYAENIFADPDKKKLLLDHNLFQPNYLGKAYGACFMSVSKFPIPDASVNANLLMNLSDNSGIFSTGIAYSPIDHTTIAFTLSHFLGPENAEYTFSGSRTALEGSLTMSF